jgi:PAS domain S-box-containing protein
MQNVRKTDLLILMLEDDALDADLNKSQLQVLEEYNCIIHWVKTKNAYLEALETTSPDIIISDYNLPQYNGIEALADLRKCNLLTPFIFVTGTLNEETAADTIKAGAWDYVVKDRLFRLPLAIRGALQLKKERQDALQAQELNRKLSMAIEQSPAHIIISNIHGITEYVNARYSEVTGYFVDEVIGVKTRIFDPEKIGQERFDAIWQSINNGNMWRGEFLNAKKDGTTFWESVSISPLKNETGEITHFVSIKEDITSRKQMEEELIKALNKAEQSDKLKEAFLQNLSHEIRTPLNAIVGFSGLLHDPDTTPEQLHEFTSIILNSSNQLLSIVSDILTIARIQTGQEIIVIKPVAINGLLSHLASIFGPRANDKGLTLTIHPGSHQQEIELLTDDTKLTQILSNLLSNAIKFTIRGSVELGYLIKGDIIEFYVKDTGIGIAPESHKIIFERFRQAEASISSNFGGTGLGLSISKSFAEMLHGDIHVKSEKDIGSVFYLKLPFKTSTEHHEKQATSLTLPHQNFKILIAEDELFNFLLIQAYLNEKNITLLRAQNGKEAIEMCHQQNDIDLILMDIKMPEMDGLTALGEIRKFRFNLPIIAQTAYALEHEKKNLLDNGFDDYIAKPIKKDELMQVIQKFI